MFKIVFEGTKDIIEEKINNPFWKTFILGWITWNWKVWYVTFFISDEKIVGNKIEYIKNMYNCFDFYGLFPSLGFFLNWVIAPLLITYLVFYIITEEVIFKFLKKHKENKDLENDILKDSIKKKIEITEIKKELVEKENKLEELEKTEFPKRDKEYNILTNKYPSLINEFKKLIIDKRGESHYANHGERTRNISSESEEILLFNDLIEEINRINGGNVIIYKTSKKGKYFLKKYTLEN